MHHLSTMGPSTALRRAVFVVALALGAAGSARAQGPAGVAAEARALLGARHEAVAAHDGTRQALASRREALAGEDARLKAVGGHPLLVGVGGGPLEDRLKQHQALAGQLGQLDRQVDAARTAETDARRSLVGALDTVIADLRGALVQGDETTRRARFERLRTLVEERSQVALAAASAPVRAVELPAVDPTRVHPGELQDLADETRDQADHVREALGQLEQRLAKLQSRRRMLVAASAFARDESLFGEDERVRRVVSVRSDSVGTADGRRLPGGETTTVGPTSGGPTSGGTTASGVDDRGAQDTANGSPSPPAAPPESAGAESDGDFAAGDPAAEATTAGGADPSPGPAPEPVAPPLAVPGVGLGLDGTLGGAQPALVVQDTLAPQLLNTDVSGLRPDALAEQIRQLQAHKRALQKTAIQLEQRRRALEQGANENGE